jgi:hypothetical protein
MNRKRFDEMIARFNLDNNPCPAILETIKDLNELWTEYEGLKTRDLFLTCLEEGGVDNWDWYGEASQAFDKRVKSGEIE